MTAYEKSIIAKWEKAKTQWWLLTPTELQKLENEAKRIYAKMENRQ